VIPLGVLLSMMDIISKCVLRTHLPKIDMPFEIIGVAILWAMCNPYSKHQFPMPDVTNCTENILIAALSAGIVRGVV
jgi:hypothetical protein